MNYKQKKPVEESKAKQSVGPNGGVMIQCGNMHHLDEDGQKPMQCEDIGLMFVMPPLVRVTREEAERMSKDFGKTKIQTILDECDS